MPAVQAAWAPYPGQSHAGGLHPYGPAPEIERGWSQEFFLSYNLEPWS